LLADGEHEIANLEGVAVADGDRLQPGGILYLQDGDVGRRVAPDEPGDEMPVVLGRHLRGARLGDHVVGGQYVTALGIDDDARADRMEFAHYFFRGAKELAKQRIVVERVFFLDLATHRDVDHARRYFAHDRRQRRHLAAASVRNLCQSRDRHRDEPDCRPRDQAQQRHVHAIDRRFMPS
jgi:hypothetical protein